MSKTLHKIYIAGLFAAGILTALYVVVKGFSYYGTPIEERFFHPDHNLLKPSGIFGHGYGIIGSLMMIIGVAVYMLRKRVRSFFSLGYLKHWLEFHIFLCTAGPLLILYHTAFKFGGIVAVSFWSMAAVVLSGFAGRFIYVQIPRNIEGKELDIRQLEEQRENLASGLKNEIQSDNNFFNEFNSLINRRNYTPGSFYSSLLIVLQDYIRIRKFTNRISAEMKKAGIPSPKRKNILGTMRNQMVLTRRIGLLRNMQKFFRYWHIIHLPFAVIMFIIMAVHIVITILFGYRWIF